MRILGNRASEEHVESEMIGWRVHRHTGEETDTAMLVLYFSVRGIL